MTARPRTLGIPTRYHGRQYRSRLEARWACFFDVLGWRAEYEPCDFEGWIPDFLLCEARPVFVEVKPVLTFPAAVAAKIDATSWAHEVLLVGVTLLSGLPGSPAGLGLGWLRAARGQPWIVAAFGLWQQAVAGRPPRIGFCQAGQDAQDRITGSTQAKNQNWRLDTAKLLALWTEAGNATQWKPPRRTAGRS